MMLLRTTTRRTIAACAVAGAAACSGSDGTNGWTAMIDTLPNGAAHVVNTPPPSGESPPWTLEEEVRIGSIDGSGPTTFGQIKAVAVDSLGRIIILESQAQELRVFDRNGRHLSTFGGKGGGPAEFEGAFGLMQTSDGLLYVPDRRNAKMSVLSPDSGFLRSYPLRLLQWGFVWDGVMREDDHILVPSMVLETRRGLIRIYSREMIQVDSVLLPEQPMMDRDDPPGAFAWRSADGRSNGFSQVPFYPTGAGFMDEEGHTWVSTPGDPAYRVVRMTAGGDTTLVLETARSPLPVTAAERDSAMSAIYESLSRFGVSRLDASKVPAMKPTVIGLFTDDSGQLWVQTSSPDSLRRYDVYDRGGEYRGSVATMLKVLPYIRPIVRGDEFYAAVTDDLDIPYVVRARIRRDPPRMP